MVARRQVALIGGPQDGQILNVDISHYALQVPVPEDQQDYYQASSVVHTYRPAVVFGRVVYVAKTGHGNPTSEELARVLLKPEVYEAWQQGRAYP